MKISRSSACVVLYFLCAAIGTSAAPVDAEQFPDPRAEIPKTTENITFVPEPTLPPIPSSTSWTTSSTSTGGPTTTMTYESTTPIPTSYSSSESGSVPGAKWPLPTRFPAGPEIPKSSVSRARSLEPSIARRSTVGITYRLVAQSIFLGQPLYARADMSVPGEVLVAMDPDSTRASPVELNNGTVAFKTGGNETLFLTWRGSEFTPSILLATLTTTAGVTNVNRDNSTGMLTWDGATENPNGWMGK
ncbi:hypothetical protein ACJ73_06135 [Blastomyces percursus]|uniref:Uncharacterized protein n=1 Tax=Blastomyces percursus TaxID=1658174 RepID=A0A1J9Q1N3_9EURO|nr:hypothetical protein ACJ73_06135 [Blastomyces percursus]